MRSADARAGEQDQPDYRSRLLGCGVNRDQGFGFFAVMPTPMSLWMATSICAPSQSG